MPWFEESCECEWVVCKLYTPPISLTGLKPIRLVGIVPAAGLAQGIVPAAEVPAGTVPARGIDRAGAVLRVPGTGRPWAGRGTDPVVGTGRLGAGPSCGCS